MDLNPIQKRFSEFKDIKKVYWKSGTFGGRDFGLTDIWLKGFIILDEEVANNLLKDYTWESSDLKFEKGISPEITEFDTFNWLYSSEFTDKFTPIDYMGNLYFDNKNRIVYFDLSTF